MAEKLEIDTRALQSDTSEIESSVAALNKSIAAMFDEVAAMNAMWKGQANQAYNNQFNSDYQTMKEILTDLTKYVSELQDAKNEYNQCEDKVGDIIRSIRI